MSIHGYYRRVQIAGEYFFTRLKEETSQQGKSRLVNQRARSRLEEKGVMKALSRDERG